MKKDIAITIIGVILAGPVMFIWHIFKGVVGGFREFLSLQKEWWELVISDFQES